MTPRAYYALCDEADALGIPTSLDDPRSPVTVAALVAAVAAAKREPFVRDPESWQAVAEAGRS